MNKSGLFGWLSSVLSKPQTPTKAPTKAPAKKKVVPDLPWKVEHHRVAGTSYRQEALQALGTKNKDYTKTEKALKAEGLTEQWLPEYKFSTRMAELVPEPENPHDPQAIKVLVDGRHIGYIKAGSCAHIHKLLRERRIISTTCELGGGRRKMLTRYDDSDPFELEHDSGPFWAKVTIRAKTAK